MSRICAQMQSLAPLAADGTLDETERARLRRHAGECPECAEALAFQARLRAAFEAAPVAAPPALYLEGALAEIHRRMPALPLGLAAPTRRTSISRQTCATAAMVALLLLWAGMGASVLGQGLTDRRAAEAPAMAMSTQRYGEGGHGHSASDARGRAPGLVILKGYGLVSSRSEILTMPDSLRRELGLPALLADAGAGGHRQG